MPAKVYGIELRFSPGPFITVFRQTCLAHLGDIAMAFAPRSTSRKKHDKRNPRHTAKRFSQNRRTLCLETMEDRQMLAMLAQGGYATIPVVSAPA